MLDREIALDKFATGKTNIIISVDALTEGLNVPDADSAIALSGFSTELNATQLLGRILRYKPGKKSVFINLYTENTVEERWVAAKTKGKGMAPYTKWVTNINDINY